MKQTDKQSLHMAAYQGDLETVTQWVRAGADVNSIGTIQIVIEGASEATEKIGSPLSLAAPNGHHNVVNYLLEQGAEISSDSAIRSDGKLILEYTILNQGSRNSSYREGLRKIGLYLENIEHAKQFERALGNNVDNAQGESSPAFFRKIEAIIEQYLPVIDRFIRDAQVLAASRLLKPKHLEELQALQVCTNRIRNGALEDVQINELAKKLEQVKIAYLSEQTFDNSAYLSVVRSLLQTGVTKTFTVDVHDGSLLNTALKFCDLHILDALIDETPPKVFYTMLQAIIQDTNNFERMKYHGEEQEIGNRLTLLVWYNYLNTQKLQEQGSAAFQKMTFELPENLKGNIIQNLQEMLLRKAFIEKLKEKLNLDTTKWTRPEYVSLACDSHLLNILSRLETDRIYNIFNWMNRLQRRLPTELSVDTIIAPLLTDIRSKDATTYPPIDEKYYAISMDCNSADSQKRQRTLQKEVKVFIEALMTSIQKREVSQETVVELLQILNPTFCASSNKKQPAATQAGTFYAEAQKIFDYSHKQPDQTYQLRR